MLSKKIQHKHYIYYCVSWHLTFKQGEAKKKKRIISTLFNIAFKQGYGLPF